MFDQEKWKQDAILHLRAFVSSKGAEKFVSSDVAQFARTRGLDEPSCMRSWGGVMAAAHRLGIVEKCGTTVHRGYDPLHPEYRLVFQWRRAA